MKSPYNVNTRINEFSAFCWSSSSDSFSISLEIDADDNEHLAATGQPLSVQKFGKGWAPSSTEVRHEKHKSTFNIHSHDPGQFQLSRSLVRQRVSSVASYRRSHAVSPNPVGATVKSEDGCTSAGDPKFYRYQVPQSHLQGSLWDSKEILKRTVSKDPTCVAVDSEEDRQYFFYCNVPHRLPSGRRQKQRLRARAEELLCAGLTASRATREHDIEFSATVASSTVPSAGPDCGSAEETDHFAANRVVACGSCTLALRGGAPDELPSAGQSAPPDVVFFCNPLRGVVFPHGLHAVAYSVKTVSHTKDASPIPAIPYSKQSIPSSVSDAGSCHVTPWRGGQKARSDRSLPPCRVYWSPQHSVWRVVWWVQSDRSRTRKEKTVSAKKFGGVEPARLVAEDLARRMQSDEESIEKPSNVLARIEPHKTKAQSKQRNLASVKPRQSQRKPDSDNWNQEVKNKTQAVTVMSTSNLRNVSSPCLTVKHFSEDSRFRPESPESLAEIQSSGPCCCSQARTTQVSTNSAGDSLLYSPSMPTTSPLSGAISLGSEIRNPSDSTSGGQRSRMPTHSVLLSTPPSIATTALVSASQSHAPELFLVSPSSRLSFSRRPARSPKFPFPLHPKPQNEPVSIAPPPQSRIAANSVRNLTAVPVRQSCVDPRQSQIPLSDTAAILCGSWKSVAPVDQAVPPVPLSQTCIAVSDSTPNGFPEAATDTDPGHGHSPVAFPTVMRDPSGDCAGSSTVKRTSTTPLRTFSSSSPQGNYTEVSVYSTSAPSSPLPPQSTKDLLSLAEAMTVLGYNDMSNLPLATDCLESFTSEVLPSTAAAGSSNLSYGPSLGLDCISSEYASDMPPLGESCVPSTSPSERLKTAPFTWEAYSPPSSAKIPTTLNAVALLSSVVGSSQLEQWELYNPSPRNAGVQGRSSSYLFSTADASSSEASAALGKSNGVSYVQSPVFSLDVETLTAGAPLNTIVDSCAVPVRAACGYAQAPPAVSSPWPLECGSIRDDDVASPLVSACCSAPSLSQLSPISTRDSSRSTERRRVPPSESRWPSAAVVELPVVSLQQDCPVRRCGIADVCMSPRHILHECHSRLPSPPLSLPDMFKSSTFLLTSSKESIPHFSYSSINYETYLSRLPPYDDVLRYLASSAEPGCGMSADLWPSTEESATCHDRCLLSLRKPCIEESS
eukprot:GHVQ01005209.1.p1 GENE.GHVQ01005209.1~~GHVQ01005209.1.p1  ORF type:complete len:1178 (-),score=137.37 GHVQ01005209.1:467-4000(-)